MDIYHLEIDGLQIEIWPKAIKNMYLRIYPPHAQIQVSVPRSFSLQEIHQQIREKRRWIDKKRNHILSLPAPACYNLEEGELHYYLGKPFRLEMITNSTICDVELIEDRMVLFSKTEMALAEKQKLLMSWFRKQMQDLIPPLLIKWETIIGVNTHQWGIKLMKTRWGSCNIRDKRIWLNLELIKKPLGCLESVLVHELVHLLERNHNSRFYYLMDQFMPEWRNYQKILNDATISLLF
jgi:predicted metal-dependent hydrolase